MFLMNSCWWSLPRIISAGPPFIVYVRSFLEENAASSKTFCVDCGLLSFQKGESYIEMRTLSQFLNSCSPNSCSGLLYRKEKSRIPWHALVSNLSKNFFWNSRLWLIGTNCDCTPIHDLQCNVKQHLTMGVLYTAVQRKFLKKDLSLGKFFVHFFEHLAIIFRILTKKNASVVKKPFFVSSGSDWAKSTFRIFSVLFRPWMKRLLANCFWQGFFKLVICAFRGTYWLKKVFCGELWFFHLFPDIERKIFEILAKKLAGLSKL